MKKLSVLLSCLFILVVFAINILAKGTLTPPDDAVDAGGKPKPFMKTLDQVEPRVLIYSVPTNITESGSYYLFKNMVYTNDSGDNGITIDCSDVILDFDGWTLRTALGSTSADGVHISTNVSFPYTRHNIVIRNGVIRGWNGDGIDAVDGMDVKVSDMKVIGNGGYGVVVGENSNIERTASRDNGSCGIEVWQGGTITECKAYGNGNAGYPEGIFADSGSRIIGCTANGNGVGIYANSYSTVKDCMALWNETNGIRVGTACRIEDNNCGYNVDGAGIVVEGTANRIDGNSVSANNEGIRINGDGNLIVRNTASGNVVTGIVVEGVNYYGKVVGIGDMSESGFTNSNPWSNFAY